MSYLTPTTPPRSSGKSYSPRSPLPPTPPTPTSIISHTPPSYKSNVNRIQTPICNEESIFDVVWSRTCITGNTILPNQLFKLLQELELELTPNARDNNFLTNDTVIKQRILEQVQQNDVTNITKDLAFDIITQCLYDVKIIDVDRGIVIGKIKHDSEQMYQDNYYNVRRGSMIDDVESVEDFDETATLMESQVDFPKKHRRIDSNQSVVSSTSSILRIRQTLQEIETFHNRLDQQYCSLEQEIISIKQKNDQDMKELRELMKNNDNMIDRIGNIREELIDMSGEFNQYKEKRGYDPLYFERLKIDRNGNLPCFLNNQIQEQDKKFHKVLQKKHRVQRMKSLSTLPVMKKVKDNRRSFYRIMAKNDRLNMINEDLKSNNIVSSDRVPPDLKDQSDMSKEIPCDADSSFLAPIEESTRLDESIEFVNVINEAKSTAGPSLKVVVTSDDENITSDIEVIQIDDVSLSDLTGDTTEESHEMDNSIESESFPSTTDISQEILSEERNTFWLAIIFLILAIIYMT